jgi:protein tyrosine phosphatase (PTP) superfamily phosphohydrolase (DUF442 family)
MNTPVGLLLKLVLAVFLVGAAPPRQAERTAPDRWTSLADIKVPVVLCIDDKPTAGGQPSTSAYAKAAANGFRSVLTLRSVKDGVDVNRERFMVERTKMRYFNIALASHLPSRQQVDEFLALVRDPANHPMLINCAFAERVAPLMMIFRIVEQGWSRDRAIEEASRGGIGRDTLQTFARDYLAPSRKPAKGPSGAATVNSR